VAGRGLIRAGVIPNGAASPEVVGRAQRYAQMVASTGRRLTHGKSAIHGTGVFTRIAHTRGAWMIEYAGVERLDCKS